VRQTLVNKFCVSAIGANQEDCGDRDRDKKYDRANAQRAREQASSASTSRILMLPSPQFGNVK